MANRLMTITELKADIREVAERNALACGCSPEQTEAVVRAAERWILSQRVRDEHTDG